MKIAVCVKQIPDPASPYELDPATHTLVRPAEQVLDDTDRYGVEVGLQIAGDTGGTVTLVSMGPAGNLNGVRQALAMGADGAILIEDEGLGGADALTTAKILAAAMAPEAFDMVIAGTESTDGYSGVVPQQIAELLDMPALTYAKKIEVEGSTVKINRQTASGYDSVEAETPVVVSVTAGVVEPRYPTFKGIMDAKKKPVDHKTISDLAVDVTIGQRIAMVVPAAERAGGDVIVDEGEAHLKIIEKLEEAKVI